MSGPRAIHDYLIEKMIESVFLRLNVLKDVTIERMSLKFEMNSINFVSNIFSVSKLLKLVWNQT